jgi:diaminohydroxyphosphoribosylaminopyrimidine deaminase/5-amino-6-(5-phosphoribosylamino)uracil reductase
MTDEDYLREALRLAGLGLGSTWPNPLVGAVIVKDQRIIARGYHHKHGQDHAELDAIKNASESIEGATVYVNLEPCCHTSKLTPPCAQRLVQEKIKKVVITNLDPNPHVNGKGVELLRSHGIDVEYGKLSSEGELLNEAFFLSQRLKRPFIHLKLASTLDGKMAMENGESQWITGEEARAHVHVMRSQHQGIIIGGETLRKDNPRLNVRTPDFSGVQPLPIIITESGDLPVSSTLIQEKRALVYTKKPLAFDYPNVVIYQTLQEILSDLFSRKLMNLMLEAGPGLTSAFMREGFIDRVSVYLNPSFLGEGLSSMKDLGIKNLNDRPRLTQIHTHLVGGDILITGKHLCSQDSSKK